MRDHFLFFWVWFNRKVFQLRWLLGESLSCSSWQTSASQSRTTLRQASDSTACEASGSVTAVVR